MKSGGLDASELVVVIRTSGERTAEACRSLLLRQLPAEVVHVVDERPFEAALRSCYRIGIESGAAWMMTVDGDVLVREGAVAELLAECGRLPRRFAQIEGLIHDKLLGGYRKAGHRVYRTEHLAAALDAVPEPGAEIRPEFSTLERLARSGLPSAECNVVFGAHDYEQYYRDLYRKAFVHAQKHPHWLAQVAPKWRSMAASDQDFLIATRGFLDGFQAPTRAVMDARAYVARSESALNDLGLREKPPFGVDAQSWADLEALQDRVLRERQGALRAATTKIATSYRRLGAARMLPYVVGSLLYHAGDRLRRMVERK